MKQQFLNLSAALGDACDAISRNDKGAHMQAMHDASLAAAELAGLVDAPADPAPPADPPADPPSA